MSPEAQVLIYTLVVFLGLLAVLWRYAWGPLMRALEEREARIARRLADSEENLRRADQTRRLLEDRLAGAKEEAAGIVAAGRQAAEKVREEIMREAHAEAQKVLARTRREILLAKEAAVHEMRGELVALTARLAGEVVRREVREGDHQRFIEESLAQLEQAAA